MSNIIIALAIVQIFLSCIILYYSLNSSCNCISSSFQNNLTDADIDNFWVNTLKCSRPLLWRDRKEALFRGRLMPGTHEAFLQRRAKSPIYQCNEIPREIPINELEYLQNIWKDSNCPGDFPMNFVKDLYSQGLQTSAVIKRFSSYVSNMKENINANNYPRERLEKSFSTCYGNNWNLDDKLIDKFKFVNSLT